MPRKKIVQEQSTQIPEVPSDYHNGDSEENPTTISTDVEADMEEEYVFLVEEEIEETSVFVKEENLPSVEIVKSDHNIKPEVEKTPLKTGITPKKESERPTTYSGPVKRKKLRFVR